MYAFEYDRMDQALPGLLYTLRGQGRTVTSRLGEETQELTHVHLALAQPLDREILVPGRKASIAAQIAETAWVLAGRDDIGWLLHYLPRAKDYSDDGHVWRGGYGPRLREWCQDERNYVDQLAHVVQLLRDQPDTRRAVISIYDPARDTAPGKDIPCNNWLHFLQRDGKLDLHVAVRSNDVLWGLSGINAFEWSVLLEVVARLVGAKVGQLHFSTTSLHLYDRHYAKADQLANPFQEAATRVVGTPSPRFGGVASVADLDRLLGLWFLEEDRVRSGQAVDIGAFPEPMLRSWLYVLDNYWNGVPLPHYLRGTRLDRALALGPQTAHQKRQAEAPATLVATSGRVAPTGLGEEIRLREVALVKEPLHPAQRVAVFSPFSIYCAQLHAGKNAAYGDSWRRRGEAVGILANIARKLDRLGTGKATADEATADTWVDLFIYLVKYQLWLVDPASSDDPQAVGQRIEDLAHKGEPVAGAVEHLNTLFDQLSRLVAMDGKQDTTPEKEHHVARMLMLAVPLARVAWKAHQLKAMLAVPQARAAREDHQWKAGNATRGWNPEA